MRKLSNITDLINIYLDKLNGKIEKFQRDLEDQASE